MSETPKDCHLTHKWDDKKINWPRHDEFMRSGVCGHYETDGTRIYSCGRTVPATDPHTTYCPNCGKRTA